MRKLIAILILSCIALAAICQNKVSVSGIVADAETGEVLIGANVVDSAGQSWSVTDNSGYFCLHTVLPAKVSVSFIGYATERLTIDAKTKLPLRISLAPDKQMLGEVTVVAQGRKQGGNVSEMSIKEISELPSMGGKPDIAKGMSLLPGISTQREGTSVLNVRGGNPGENMYLFDNVPIIYVNHLGGFFSTFNPDIINDIRIYKGGFPARYGGKLSSIVDITQKEGNKNKHCGSLHVGLTDISATAEGPAGLKNSSYIVCARKTMIGALLLFASYLADQNYLIGYGFYDLNGKFSWSPTDKDKLTVNLYIGDDYLGLRSKKQTGYYVNPQQFRLGYMWGNVMASVQYKRILGNKTFLSAGISHSRYRLRTGYKIKQEVDTLPDVRSRFLSSLDVTMADVVVKHDFFKFWNMEAGVQGEFQSYLPTYNFEQKNTIYRPAAFAYLSTTLQFLKYSSATLGVRANGIMSSTYRDFSIEPRASLTFGFSPNHRLGLSYMTATQYSHLIFTSGSIMNNEVWIPSGENINPAKVTQYSAEWESDFLGGKLAMTIGGYYKSSTDLATYKDGFTNFIGDDNWESKVETGGIGRAYGVEFLLRKKAGRFTGFVGYTYARSFRKYANINNGEEFPYDFDRPHNFNIAASYRINEKFKVSATWTYQTGIPYTPALGKQYVPAITEEGELYMYECLIYGERNSGRMKDYHRLDLALTYEYKTKKGRDAAWSFNIYNAYFRQNPFFYYYNNTPYDYFLYPSVDSNSSALKLYQVSYFPFLASFSYKVYFGGK
ncbi:MAG: carboxypeptidase-like regulatory domain-containing protein [Bacteroidales bacterium]|nr:carboxypeptidase-like regulatory domain-containing protein [Bacteroidales bacterium]